MKSGESAVGFTDVFTRDIGHLNETVRHDKVDRLTLADDRAIGRALGIAALIFTVVAILDVVIALGLYPFLSGAGALLAWTAVVLRITYAAVLVAAAGILVGASDGALFAAIWQLGLFDVMKVPALLPLQG